MLRIAASIAALTALVLALAFAGGDPGAWHADTQRKMGTKVEVQIWHKDAARARELLDAAMAELDRIEAAMSTYRADSEISRVNRLAATEAVPVSQELYDLVARSLELSALSDGAFDITFDSVGQLYSFRDGLIPGEEALQSALPALDYRLVTLDPAARTIRFAREGVRINLGGIGKGYACEQVAALLQAAGVEHALINAGGDTRLVGDRRGRPWLVGIRDPDDAATIVSRLPLVNEAISTSGDYERYFIDDDGTRYHHILDPGTGRSASSVRSVSVIGPDATLTDALSTTLFILGTQQGLALIESIPDYEAAIIDLERKLHFSSGLQGGG